MAAIAAYLALFALSVWPGGIARLAMGNEIPPGAADFASRIEPHMQRQGVFVGDAEAENQLVQCADVSGIAAAGIPQDEFEQ